jgi:hypothetical protein
MRRWLGLLALGAGWSACEASETPSTDTSDGAVVIWLREAGPLPDAAPVSCGGTQCAEPHSTPLSPGPCCGDAGGCGVESPMAAAFCALEPGLGGPDLNCPDVAAFDGAILQGCCSPDGSCGAFDRFGTFGCIPGANLVSPPVACRYKDATRCDRVVEVACDGPEDCPLGFQCCARVQPDHYDAFGCFPDCRAIVDGRHGVWLPLCHPGEPCERAGQLCSTVPELPLPYARCYPSLELEVDSGPPEPFETGVRCGDETCATGEKCCLRPPKRTYCSPIASRCECAPDLDASVNVDGGVADASVDGHREP